MALFRFSDLLKSLFLMVVIFLSAFQSVVARDYFVDIDNVQANDNNEGTESEPFKSIQKAANVAEAGDTVYVKSGVYTELYSGNPDTGIKALKPQNSGTEGSPIVFKAYRGEEVIIDQSNQGFGVYIEGKSYITIDGFEIRNCKGSGIKTHGGANNISIINNEIHNVNDVAGTNVGGIRIDNSSDVLIKNNLIYDIKIDGGTSNFNIAGILSYNMENVVIESNTIHGTNKGVYHKRASGNTGALIKKNRMFDIKTGIFYGIAGSGDPSHINQRVTQNLIIGADTFVDMSETQASTRNQGLHIWNNTFIADSESRTGVHIAHTDDVNIYNNIFYGSMNNGAIRTKETEVSIDNINFNNYFEADYYALNVYTSSEKTYNSLTSWRSGESHDLQGTNTNPVFADNYKLANSSPLRGAGADDEDVGAYLEVMDFIGYYGKQPKIPTSVQ